MIQPVPQNAFDSAGTELPAADRALVGESYEVLRAQLRDCEVAMAAGGSDGLIGVRSPVREGRGHWDYIKVSEHLIVSLVDAVYDRDTWIAVPGDRLFKIRILISGTLLRRDGTPLIEGTGAFLAAYPGAAGDGYTAVGGQRLRLLVLHCDHALLTEELGLGVASIPDPLSRLFGDGPDNPVGANVRLGAEVLRAANDIIRTPPHYPRALRRAYIAARSHEIVLAVLKQLSVPDFVIPDGIKLTMRDISRIYEARDILSDAFVAPPSIERLARLVGLNQTKLKSAFKLVFGLTAYEFVRQCRMETAAEMLLTSDRSIAEIAYGVGFEYPANFTHAYQRFYGQLPSDARSRR